MKKIFWIGLVSAGLNLSALGAMYSYGPTTFNPPFANGTSIPSGSLSGWADTETVSGLAPTLVDVSVTVNVSGSYNGDLYAYISHNGQIAVLLNRVGVGSSDPFGNTGSGINVTFSSTTGSGQNIHFATYGPLGGTYTPDGRNISPLSSPGAFDTTPSGNALNTAFAGNNPNGTWTLFIADTMSAGDNFSVISWGMQIDAVPEPVNVALGIFGLCAVGGAVVGKKWKAERGKAERGKQKAEIGERKTES
jgi:subtilisin-like proprotein convertase family protein